MGQSLPSLFRKSRPAAPPSEQAAHRRAFFGTIALSLVNSGRLALQLLVLPVMARILGPAAFGLVSLAMPFILFANMLSDAGMGNALIRRQDPTREIESTVFWLCVGVGLTIALTICASSGLIAGLLRQPGLAPILIGLSPILVLSSTLSVANARISRARHFGLFAVGDLISAILSSGAAITAALHGWGAWSLVVQQLVLWTVKAAWILPVSRFRPALVCRPSLARDLLSFGLHSVGADIADFAGKSAPALVIGSGLGVVAVGHYSMAYQLIRIPDLVLSGPLYLATFTAVSALAANAAGAAPLSMRTIRMVVSMLAPLFCGLALVSDLVITAFLGPKWQGTAPVLATLAGAGFFLCLYSLFGAVLMGLGRSDLQFRLSLLSGGAMVVGALVGERFGLNAAAIGVAAGAALAFPFYVVTLSGQLRIDGRATLVTIGRPLIATAVMGLTVLAVRNQLPAAADAWLKLAACVASGVLAFTVTLCATSGRQILDDVKMILPARGSVRHEVT
jgi:PST family polysaccharide transporter